MKYRNFGKLNWKVSALGFGAMRLPTVGGDSSKIDEAEAIKMIRYAIDHGVNYIDTAYPYHGGNSEILVGKALKDGYREKVRLATKLPTWLLNSKEDTDKYLNEQLKKLETEKIDFYLLHGLNKERWPKMINLNVIEWTDKAISEGKIRYLGFSFHDDFSVLKEIIDSTNKWTFCQFQYNYMDTDFQAGTKGLKYVASKGLGAVIMEPIAGGMLALKPPTEIQKIWDDSKVKRTPAEWALQWVWNQPEVSVVLSGMSTMEQVIENVKSASRSGPGKLTQEDLRIIEKVREKYREFGFIGCTGCRYCMPCPQGVNIPQIFALSNEHGRKRGDSAAQAEVIKKYNGIVSAQNGAKNCVQCGQCETKCPQKLPIQKLVAQAGRTFEGVK